MITIGKRGLPAWITTKLKRTGSHPVIHFIMIQVTIGMISFTVLKKILPTTAPLSRDWAVRKKYLDNEEVFFTFYGQNSSSLLDALYQLLILFGLTFTPAKPSCSKKGWCLFQSG